MPIALHLDHSTSYTAVLRAIRCGFNSVMIDGSTLPLDENISITPKVAEIGCKLGVYTEADLGHATSFAWVRTPMKNGKTIPILKKPRN